MQYIVIFVNRYEKKVEILYEGRSVIKARKTIRKHPLQFKALLEYYEIIYKNGEYIKRWQVLRGSSLYCIKLKV